jgi:hypothetical protein
VIGSRRRRLPLELRPAFDAFVDVVAHVERGKSALTGSMPSTRFAGRPLAESLLEFEEELSAARAGMAAWRRPEVDEAWTAADRGLRTSLGRAERLRTEAPDPGGFEGLIRLIGDLLEPLEGFGDARDAWLRMRVRGSSS